MPYVGRMTSVRTLQPLQPPVAAARSAQPPTAAEFPGCKPVRLPREELDDCEMRLEYWDTASETACDPVSSCHEDEAQVIMQADELVYLHPTRARLPRPALTIGEHDFPDVVLEVDHTTDVT